MAPATQTPLLFIHGDEDQIIPWKLGHRLFERANQPKRWIAVEGAGHNDLIATDPGAYYDTVFAWLSEYAPLPDSKPDN